MCLKVAENKYQKFSSQEKNVFNCVVMLIRLIAVIILQCIPVVNHCVAHLKQIYVNYLSIKKEHP